MASITPVKLQWSEKLRFHVAQAKHCADTGDFAYFHASRARHVSKGIDHLATLQAQGVPQDELDKLTNINVSTTESSEVATTELEEDVKAVKVDDKLPEEVKKAEWTKKLTEKNDAAKKKVNDAMDAGLDEAITLISALPDDAQDTAADFFMQGMDIAMEAFDFMVQKISQLYNAVVDFMKKIWTALQNAWNAVSGKVISCVKRLFGFKAVLQTNGADTVTAPGAEPTRFTLMLAFDYRIPDDAIVDSTQEIWLNYVKASNRDTQSYSMSTAPEREGPGPTSRKIMTIFWIVRANGNAMKVLMDQACAKEEKKLAKEYTFFGEALMHRILDMIDPPEDEEQQVQSVAGQRGKVLRNVRHNKSPVAIKAY